MDRLTWAVAALGVLGMLAACGGGGGPGAASAGAVGSLSVGQVTPSRVWAYLPTDVEIRGSGFGSPGDPVTVRFVAQEGSPFQGGVSSTLETTGVVEAWDRVRATTLPAGVDAPTPARVEVVLQNDFEASTDDAVFTFTPATDLQPFGGGATETFGAAVSLDGTRVAVGAPSEASDAGAAYLFRKEPTGWTPEQRVESASAGATAPSFGEAVDVSGDVLVVGAPGENEGRGAAHVFELDSGTWVETARLVRPAADPSDAYGESVSADRDTLVVVGAGVADVWVRGVGGWAFQATLVGEGPGGAERVRCADLKGDTVALGAPGADAGAVHVFVRDGATWSRTDRLAAADAQAGDLFGADVSLADGLVLVGAPGRPTPENLSGLTYLYGGGPGAWSLRQEWSASHWVTGSVFGENVAVTPSVVLVGAFHHIERRGAAFLFEPADASALEVADLSPYGLPPGASFGRSLDARGRTAVVGAEGVVFVFDL